MGDSDSSQAREPRVGFGRGQGQFRPASRNVFGAFITCWLAFTWWGFTPNFEGSRQDFLQNRELFPTFRPFRGYYI